MYCRRCGKELPDGAVFCPSCGEPQDGRGVQRANYQTSVYDSGSFGWAILGFMIPIVGLILWLAWNSDRPQSAKMAGLGALVSVVLGIVIWIFMIILILSVGVDDTTVNTFVPLL